MKIVRFRKMARVAYGVINGDEISEVRGSIFSTFRITDTVHKMGDVKLMPPTDPLQIMGSALNEAKLGAVGPASGSARSLGPWHKGRNGLVGHEDFIIIPKESGGDVHCAGEPVAVIRKRCRRVRPERALTYVLGYTCGNDVRERTWEGSDGSLWRARGSDTFAPVGPWIETNVDLCNLVVALRVNGQEVQGAVNCDVSQAFAHGISYISQYITLHPGDLIFSSTTVTTSHVVPGDVVEVDISGIGVLLNTVKAEEQEGSFGG